MEFYVKEWDTYIAVESLEERLAKAIRNDYEALSTEMEATKNTYKTGGTYDFSVMYDEFKLLDDFCSCAPLSKMRTDVFFTMLKEIQSKFRRLDWEDEDESNPVMWLIQSLINKSSLLLQLQRESTHYLKTI